MRLGRARRLIFFGCEVVVVKYVALADLPHGQKTGQVFEETEGVGDVLIRVGLARLATDEEIEPTKPARRRYQRRDLEATPD